MSNPDFLAIALRYPNAVVCLTSALSFHEITTQIPHEVSLAVSRGSRTPSIEYPPLHVYQFNDKAYRAGIQEHMIDGATVKVYSPEKNSGRLF